MVALQETATELGHVAEAVEVLEVDVGHVARAELLAEGRQSNPGTATAVVSPVSQAAEHLAVPRGADHHVRQLDRAHTVGVTELLQTPAVSPLRSTLIINFLHHTSDKVLKINWNENSGKLYGRCQ